MRFACSPYISGASGHQSPPTVSGPGIRVRSFLVYTLVSHSLLWFPIPAVACCAPRQPSLASLNESRLGVSVWLRQKPTSDVETTARDRAAETPASAVRLGWWGFCGCGFSFPRLVSPRSHDCNSACGVTSEFHHAQSRLAVRRRWQDYARQHYCFLCSSGTLSRLRSSRPEPELCAPLGWVGRRALVSIR